MICTDLQHRVTRGKTKYPVSHLPQKIWKYKENQKVKRSIRFRQLSYFTTGRNISVLNSPAERLNFLGQLRRFLHRLLSIRAPGNPLEAETKGPTVSGTCFFEVGLIHFG